MRAPKSFCLHGLDLSVFSILEIKLRKLYRFNSFKRIKPITYVTQRPIYMKNITIFSKTAAKLVGRVVLCFYIFANLQSGLIEDSGFPVPASAFTL